MSRVTDVAGSIARRRATGPPRRVSRLARNSWSGGAGGEGNVIDHFLARRHPAIPKRFDRAFATSPRASAFLQRLVRVDDSRDRTMRPSSSKPSGAGRLRFAHHGPLVGDGPTRRGSVRAGRLSPDHLRLIWRPSPTSGMRGRALRSGTRKRRRISPQSLDSTPPGHPRTRGLEITRSKWAPRPQSPAAA